jgi:hypothetical protein
MDDGRTIIQATATVELCTLYARQLHPGTILSLDTVRCFINCKTSSGALNTETLTVQHELNTDILILQRYRCNTGTIQGVNMAERQNVYVRKYDKGFRPCTTTQLFFTLVD